MKFFVCIFIFFVSVQSFNKAYALSDECAWSSSSPIPGSTELRVWSVVAPQLLTLRRVPIGSVMASSAELIVHSEGWQRQCPPKRYPTLRQEVFFKNLELVDGFDNVYKTRLEGIGVRVLSVGSYKSPIPFVRETTPNHNLLYSNVPDRIKFEFVRISRDVEAGDVPIKLTIHDYLNGWHAAEITVLGTTKLKSEGYFSGCAGVEKMNISMGRVLVMKLEESNTPFNLDVLCSGMSAGTNVPVKVYFEGSSDGPGRLNLEPGGAKGVEISLLSSKGVKLPFLQSSALAMTWIRSEPQGELYRLPVVAEYVKKASQKAEAGRANATLNYVLEYN
ncbi:fimbrial protein [Pseudomonas monsensis]|uniref:fimbrial protein n=1 Tax=Pseudomonas monsensis TaxID=2745509 RepID=UPI00300E946E